MTTQQPLKHSGWPEIPPGMELLNRPGLNKGTAFTEAERSALGLHGLVPPQVERLEEQVVRAYEAYQRKGDDLERHIYLRTPQDTNEVLKEVGQRGRRG
jgi:malate dehydrogenase (oxaloacetate-decarboxylating)